MSHATGQVARAMEYEAQAEGCAEKKEQRMGAPPESKAPLSTTSAQNGMSDGGRSGGICAPDSA